MATISTLAVHLKAKTSQFQRDMRNTNRQIEQFEENTDNASNAMEAFGKIANVATAGVAALTGAIAAGIKKTADFADQIDKTSMMVNASTEGFQEMRFALQQVGVGQATMVRSMDRLNQAVGRARRGEERYIEIMKDAGFTQADLRDQHLMTEEVFVDTIRNLGDLEDSYKATAIAGEIFGTRMSRQILPALQAGEGALEEWIERAKESGIIMDDELIRKFVYFRDELNLTTQSFRMGGRMLIAQFLPAATKLLERVQSLTSWFANLDDETRENIARWTMIAGGIMGVIATINILGRAMQWLVIPIMKPVIALGILAAKLLLPIATLSLLYKAWQEDWGGIRTYLENTYDEYLEPILEWLHEKLLIIDNLLSDSINWTIDLAGDAWYWLTETTMEEKLNDIRRLMEIGWDWFVGIVGGAWEFLKEIELFDGKVIKSTWEWTIRLAEFLADPTGITGELENMFPNWNFWEFLEDRTGLKAPWLEDAQSGQSMQEGMTLTEQDKKDIALMTRLEAGNQPFEGQVAVAEVILNRVLSDDFPNTVEEVIRQSGQFEPLPQWEQLRDENINLAQQMEALEQALTDNVVGDAVFFANLDIVADRGVMHPLMPGGSGTITSVIGDHTFGFAQGGYTGAGGASKPAGIVHAGEYVLPKWMVDRMPALVSMLEDVRGKGFKSGGGVGFQAGGLAGSLIGDEGFQNTLNNLADQFGSFESILTTMQDVGNLVLDGVEMLGSDILGEETVAEIRERFENVMMRITEFSDGLFDMDGALESLRGNTSDASEDIRLLQDRIRGFTDSIIEQIPALQNALNAYQQAGGGAQGLIDAFMSLIMESQAVQAILTLLSNVLTPIIEILGMVLLPIFTILAPPLDLLATLFRNVANALIGFWNGLMDLLSKIPFVNMDKYKLALVEAEEVTSDTTDQFDDLNDVMAVRGFRRQLQTFQATTPEVPSAQVGAEVIRSGLVNVHAGETITPGAQTDSGQPIIIEGDVYGYDDFSRKVNEAIDRKKVNKSLSSTGSTGRGRR